MKQFANQRTIYEQLLEMGMKPEELDNYASDLYVLKNAISDKFVASYEYRQQVKTFRSNTDGKTWYEIPFGYMPEYAASRLPKGDR